MSRVIPEGQVGFGIQLPVQAQSTLFVEPWERDAGADQLAAVARAADRAGFLYVGVCDHVAIPQRAAEAMGTVWYDTIATLGFLAGVTERVRLLSHVYVPAYRHPLQVAKAFATVDALSKGRAIIGLGAGHLAEEFDALGIDFAQRGRLLDDAIDALIPALADEMVDGMAVAPRPVQRPRPPVWIGGSSPAALRRAAERGDGWLPQGTRRRDLPGQIEVLRRHRDAARPGQPIDIGANAEPIYVGDPSWEVPRRTTSGAPEAIATSLRELVAMGVSHIQLKLPSRSCTELEDQIAAFGRDVAPLVAGGN